MDSKIKEVDGYLICIKHNKKIRMMMMDKSVTFLDSFLCQQCMDEKSKMLNNIISLKTALEEINSKQANIEVNAIGSKLQLLNNFWSTSQKSINYQQTEDDMIKLVQKDQQNDDDQNPIKCQLIQVIKQDEQCYAIAFNSSGSIMVSGCEEDIKVWKREEGTLVEQQRLKGHQSIVSYLIFSKKMNWFASGSNDNTIRGWQEQADKTWISTQAQAKSQHKDQIMCLILTRNEDELISCSYDHKIKVWKVNCQENKIQFEYTLPKKHYGLVLSISMNESETVLVSCSDSDSRGSWEEQAIVLWVRGENQRWQFSHILNLDDFGYRLCFFNDNQFTWQQHSQGITHVFQVENGKFYEKEELKIKLNDTKKDNWLFPTIFNQKKQIMIQKHNQYAYILKKSFDGHFKVVSEPINCVHEVNFGTLSEDGQSLVIWNIINKEFAVHKITYG